MTGGFQLCSGASGRTVSPRSLSLCFRLKIFWSWSARSISRSSCSFLDSHTSVCSLAFSVCRMATVLAEAASCRSSSARLSDSFSASAWTEQKGGRSDEKQRERVKGVVCNRSTNFERFHRCQLRGESALQLSRLGGVHRAVLRRRGLMGNER